MFSLLWFWGCVEWVGVKVWVRVLEIEESIRGRAVGGA